jgi:phosphatidylglycerol---prolipoprotein diacylglyceryl transferase
MIPVIYKFLFDGPFEQGLLYLLALGLVAYGAHSGWRSASGPAHKKTGEPTPPTREQRLYRALGFGAVGAVVAALGLHYALPAGAFLGGKGEGLPIHAYGILLATGFIGAVNVSAALAFREWRGEEGHKKREQVMDLAFWVLAAGIGGSRVLFILVNWQDYARQPGKIFSLEGGFVFYGGLLGAMGAAYVFSRLRGIDFLRLGDIGLPAVSLGQCLGRLGCFSAGCCWGDVASAKVAWAVNFPGLGLVRNLFGQPGPTASLAFDSMARDQRFVVVSTGEVLSQPVAGAVRISEWVAQHGHTLPLHPTQLYESVGQLAMFVGLLALRRYRRFHGQILAVWLMGYALLRTSVELFRGDVERGTLNGLLRSLGLEALATAVPLEAWYNVSTSQFISLCMFALGATVLYRHGKVLFSRPEAALAAPAR